MLFLFPLQNLGGTIKKIFPVIKGGRREKRIEIHRRFIKTGGWREVQVEDGGGQEKRKKGMKNALKTRRVDTRCYAKLPLSQMTGNQKNLRKGQRKGGIMLFNPVPTQLKKSKTETHEGMREKSGKKSIKIAAKYHQQSTSAEAPCLKRVTGRHVKKCSTSLEYHGPYGTRGKSIKKVVLTQALPEGGGLFCKGKRLRTWFL